MKTNKLEKILKVATPIVILGLVAYRIYQREESPEHYLNRIREKGFLNVQ